MLNCVEIPCTVPSAGPYPRNRRLKPEGVEAQAKRTLDNLGAVLEAAGMNYTSVVKTTVF